MQRINEDIKNSNFKQIYLLYGEERYLKNQYTTRLRKALCQEGDEMNTHFYQGKDFSVGEVIDLAETLPFLAERRVMFFKDTGLFKAGGEKLAEYLASPNDTTFFVFTESEVDKRSKLYKTVQSKGYVAEFTVQDENSLKRWIAGILGREGKKISENTAQLLLSKTGTDMENIQMELEKLICCSFRLPRSVTSPRLHTVTDVVSCPDVTVYSAGTTGIRIRLPPPLSHICSNAHTPHISGCYFDFFKQSIRYAVNIFIFSNHNGIGKFWNADRLPRRCLCHLHRYVMRIDPCATWEIQNLTASFMDLYQAATPGAITDRPSGHLAGCRTFFSAQSK